MYRDGHPIADVFAPFNVLTGALARARGADLGTMILIALGLELAEAAFVHYWGDRFDARRPDFTTSMGVGMLATAAGWTLADCALNGGFSRAS